MEVQQVKHLHLELEKKSPNIAHDYMVFEKLDGWYCYIDYSVELGWGRIMSRAGRPIPSMEYLHPKLSELLGEPGVTLRLIAEAIIPDTPFHALNGIFNRSVGDYYALDAVFAVHDIVFPSKPTEIAIDRFAHIYYILPSNSTKFFRAELLQVSDSPSLWKTCFDKVVADGGEGIILKQVDGIYCPGKRNSTLMKIKEEVDADLLCISLYDTVGEKGGENLNMILQDSKGNETVVRVGKLEEAELYRASPNKAIGHVFKIKAMKRLSGGKFREPRLDYRRDDKTGEEID